MPPSENQQTPLEFLIATMRDTKADGRLRIEAAKAAAPYVHIRVKANDRKLPPDGKKVRRNKRAEEAAAGKFAPAAAPKLVVNNR